MRKIFTKVSLFFLFLSPAVYSQTVSGGNTSGGTTGLSGTPHIKWTKKPFDHQVFIENKGQFDGIIPGNDKVLYGAQLGQVWAFFTSHGIIFRYAETPKRVEIRKDKDPDKDGDGKLIIHYMNSDWEGANPSVAVSAMEERSDYYDYSDSKGGTIKTNIFNKLIYRNIYPGIDIEYMFPKGKEGFKYSLIVHPGADVSKAVLKYIKAQELKLNNNGDVVFNSPVGEFTDHSPVGNYLGGMENIDVSYKITGNTESFKINGNYDKSKTLVIDPWVTDPLIASYDRAYDICYDYFGNVYAYGGQMPFQLVKFNALGVIQWTYTVNQFTQNSIYYGAFAVDRKTGTSYVTSGFWESAAQVLKINTLGNLLATYNGNRSINEMWRAVYNPCYDNIIIGAGGTTDTNQACMLDTNLVNIIGVNFLHTQSSDEDIALVCVDPSGLYCYMATVQTAGDVFAQLPLPNLNPPTYVKPDHFYLQESAVAKYIANEPGASGAMNGMAASPNWLYLYNGQSLEQYHKNTGILNDSIAVSNTEEQWGGIDVDPCDDVFLGCQDSVKYYDGSLALQGSITMPNTVYCLTLGQNDLLYVGGDGFVTEVGVPSPAKLISSASGAPSSCSACNGQATVNINCGVAPFLYKWSNGNTNQTDTGMCSGIYIVKVTDGSCPPRTDSAVVIISGKPGYNASVKDTNPGCALFRGNITAYPTGGAPPYSYLWSNGSTNQKDTGLVAGTYTCTITDNTGCKTFVLVTLINPLGPAVGVKPAQDSICAGSQLSITASGAKTYKWTPSLGLSCNNCPNPIATPSVTTVYMVIGTDSNGCKDSVTSKIIVYAVPHPTITGKDSVCSGYIDTMSVTGGTTYLWSTGATTTSIFHTTIATETITVTANNGPCTHDTSFVIHVVASIAKLTFNKDSICKGDSANLRGSGGVEYKWSNGNTTTSIWVKPLTTQTYTLYAYAGSCRDSAVQKVKIIPAITASISISKDSICPHGSTTITAKGIGGQATYSWNTGATTSSITVSDTVTTTYTATVYGICDSTKVIKNVIVVPLPKPVIKGTNWKCKGVRDTLTVTSSTNPTKYVWSDGKTTTSITTGNINADSTIIVTGYNSLGCPNKDTFEIGIRQPPSPSGTVSIFCAGQALVLTASATGVNPPFSYKWSTGQTGSSITIDPGPDSPTTYTVQASNGCIGSGTVTAIPNIPNLNACCNQTLIIEDDSAVRNDTTILVASGNSTKYQWQENPNSGQITCIDPPLCDSVKVSTTVTTTYTVTGTDVNGCTTDQLVTINIEVMCFDIRVPNVITPTVPGPQGLNGEFYIRTKDINAWSIVIYDRWGKEVYSSTNQYEYWKGTTESGGKAPEGVYYYIIKGTCQNNTYKKDGFVQLIR